MSTVDQARLFPSDDEFLTWAAANPKGFVLNLRSNFDPGYVVLHKASCGALTGNSYLEGALTQRWYSKVGADSPDALLDWIRAHVGGCSGFSKHCGLCKP